MTGNFFQIRLITMAKSSPNNFIIKSGNQNNFLKSKRIINNINFFKGGESDINFFYNLFFLSPFFN